MAYAIIPEQNLQDIADAIRAKNGTQDTYKPGQMAAGVLAIPQGGDLDGIVDGSIVAFEMPAGMTSIAPYRFYNMTALQSAEFGSCETIGEYAFNGCTGLGEIDLKNVTTIGQYAFNGCTNLEFKDDAIPSTVASIGSYAFRNAGKSGTYFSLNPSSTLNIPTYAFQASCIGYLNGNIGNVDTYAFMGSILQEIDVNAMGNVAANAFQSCPGLTKIVVPIVGSVGNYAFGGNNAVTMLNLTGSRISSLGTNAFQGIGASRSNPSSNPFAIDLSDSSFTTVSSYAFAGSSSSAKNKYTTIKLPSAVTSVQANTFMNCDYCDVYFTGSSVPSLGNSNAFSGFTNGHIFVPYNIAHAWSTTTNWAASAVVSLIAGYSPENTFTVGQTLPAINVEGYALTWYSDAAMTTQVTTVADASAKYYCSVGSTQVGYGITRIYTADCSVVVSDGVNTYQQGEGIATGTTVTITATPTDPSYVVYGFTVNGNNFTSGDTVTVSSALDIIAMYWDGVHEPINPTLADNDWAIIGSVCRAGNALQYWNIGDTINISLTNSQTITYRLSDGQSGRYALSSGNGASHVVFEPVQQISNVTRTMNSSASNAGGYANSQMRTYLNSTIYDMFPANVKQEMSQVKVLSGTGGGSTSGTSSSDNYLFLMAECEMAGKSYSIGTDECPLGKYDYYNTHTTATDRIKQRDGSNQTYWLRSPQSGTSFNFVGVTSVGNIYYYTANNTYGVAPCFAI